MTKSCSRSWSVVTCNSAGSQTTGSPCCCTAHLHTDSRLSYHCPAATSQCCRTGKTSVLAHRLLITPSGPISCSPEIRPQNTSQQPKTRCNSLAEAELHLSWLLFSSLCSKIISPPPLSFLHPIPTHPAPKAMEETQHRSPVVASHRKPAGDAGVGKGRC